MSDSNIDEIAAQLDQVVASADVTLPVTSADCGQEIVYSYIEVTFDLVDPWFDVEPDDALESK